MAILTREQRIASQAAQLAGSKSAVSAAQSARQVVAASPAVPQGNGSFINTTPAPAVPKAIPAPTTVPITAPQPVAGLDIKNSKTGFPGMGTTATTTPTLDIKPTTSTIEQNVTAAQTEAQKTTDAQASMQADYYKLYQQGEDLVKRGIVKTNPYPSTYTEYLKSQGTRADSEAAYLQKQNSAANALDQSALQREKNQGASAVASVTSAMAQSREGVMGSSKPLVAAGFSQTQNQILDEATQRVGLAASQRQKAEEDLAYAQSHNMDAKTIEVYAGQVAQAKKDQQQASIDAANAEAQASQNALGIIDKLGSTGMLAGASPTELAGLAAQFNIPVESLNLAARAATQKGASTAQAENFKNQTTALTTLKSLAESGITMSPSMISQYAKSTGLTADSIMSFNDLAIEVLNDKSLSGEQKSQIIAEKGLQLEQEQRGIWGQEMQKMDYINKQIKAGASQEEIDSLKTMMGITTDSKQEAELALSQANAAIKNYEAANLGKPPPKGTPEYYDYQKKKIDAEKAQSELNEIKGISNKVGSYDVDGVIKSGVDTVPKVGAQFSTAIGDGVITGYGSKAWDKGLDFVVSGGMGADVRAPIDGEVIEVSSGHKRGEKGSFGNQVKIRTATGEEVWLSHLESASCEKGDIVTAGQVVGAQGNTGTTYGKTGVHVDITMKNSNGGYYNAKEVASFLGNIGSAEKQSDVTNVDYTGFESTLPAEAKTKFEGLSSMDKSNVSQLLSGDALVTDLIKGRGANTGPEIQKLLQKAQSIDPTFSKTDQDVRYNFKKQWATPTGKPFQARTSLNTALEHLSQLKTASTALPAGWSTDTNTVANYLSQHTGDPAVADFEYTVGVMAAEIASAYKGGSATDQEIENDRKAIMANLSQQQMSTVLNTAAKLLGSKVSAMGDEYKNTMGVYPDSPLIHEEAIKNLKASGINVSPLEATIERQVNNKGAKVAERLKAQEAKAAEQRKGMADFFHGLVTDTAKSSGALVLPEDIASNQDLF